MNAPPPDGGLGDAAFLPVLPGPEIIIFVVIIQFIFYDIHYDPLIMSQKVAPTRVLPGYFLEK